MTAVVYMVQSQVSTAPSHSEINVLTNQSRYSKNSWEKNWLSNYVVILDFPKKLIALVFTIYKFYIIYDTFIGALSKTAVKVFL